MLFGYFSDLALNTVSLIPFDGSIEMSILFLILSIFLTALGIFVYMPADIAPLPGEGCVEAIAIVSGWRFSTIKIAFDAVMVVISLIMCGLWYTNILGAVNIGTVISAFMVGFTLRQIIICILILQALRLRLQINRLINQKFKYNIMRF